MSVSIVVYLSSEATPSPDAWGAACAAEGVSLDLQGFAFESGGFLPARWQGREGGFEYDYGEATAKDRERLRLTPNHDRCVVFTTHSSMDELATAILASAALCTLTRGTLIDESSGEVVGADGVAACASEVLGAIAAER